MKHTGIEMKRLLFLLILGIVSLRAQTVIVCNNGYDSEFGLCIGYAAIGQSFTGTGVELDSCQIWLRRAYYPSGTCRLKLYAHSGTYGTSSLPTGSPLATSDSIVIDNLPTTLYTQNFIFSSPYTPVNGTHYVLVFEISPYSYNSYHQIYVEYQQGGTADGSMCMYVSDITWGQPLGWQVDATDDWCFCGYNTAVTPQPISPTILTLLSTVVDTVVITPNENEIYESTITNYSSVDTIAWRTDGTQLWNTSARTFSNAWNYLMPFESDHRQHLYVKNIFCKTLSGTAICGISENLRRKKK